MKRRDGSTLDLFLDYEPRSVVARFDEHVVRASNDRGRVARAVAATLRDHDGERAAIAQEMSSYLGERVSEAMLNRYASQGAEEHAISAHRLIALAVITGDARLINALLADTGLIAISEKYEALIRREQAREAAERLQRVAASADAEWRAKR
jgi:regulatory protein CII